MDLMILTDHDSIDDINFVYNKRSSRVYEGKSTQWLDWLVNTMGLRVSRTSWSDKSTV